MQGIVSLLDDVHYRLVEKVRDELAQKYDVRGLYVTTYPHFSYQVAEQYDGEACESFLRELAARTSPFKIRTAGLGVFTISIPILYVPLVRSPQLSDLHRQIWEGVRQAAPGAVAHYYSPDEWVPHVTLAQGDIDPDKLSEIVRRLCSRNFHWEFYVNNVAMIYDAHGEQGVRCRFNFGGKKADD